MLQRSFWVAALVGATLVPGFAQSAKQTLTVQAHGNFTFDKETSDGSYSAEQTAGLLLTYNRALTEQHGFQLNYGAMRIRHEFLSSVVTPAGRFGANTHVNQHEFSLAYVYRLKDIKKLRPFAFGGAGAIMFDQVQAGATSPTKFEFIYGAGADVDINEKAFFRVMYRGQAYRIPGLAHLFGPYVSGFAHVMQPTIGVGFRF